MPTAVLVDDEPNLSQHLARLLLELWPELEIVGVANNGEAALELVSVRQPDLLFLDIQMPKLNGLEVAKALAANRAPTPLLVFATAYDDYAVAAFESSATDYLLKPVTRARLQKTIKRLQGQLQSPTQANAATLSALLEKLEQPAQPSHLQWLRSGHGNTTELVAVADVVYFKSEHKYTSAYTPSQDHLLRLSLKELAAQLDPNQFWQIHRSLIVNVQDIGQAKRDLRGRYTLTLKRRSETLRSSPAFSHLFKHM